MNGRVVENIPTYCSERNPRLRLAEPPDPGDGPTSSVPGHHRRLCRRRFAGEITLESCHGLRQHIWLAGWAHKRAPYAAWQLCCFPPLMCPFTIDARREIPPNGTSHNNSGPDRPVYEHCRVLGPVPNPKLVHQDLDMILGYCHGLGLTGLDRPNWLGETEL